MFQEKAGTLDINEELMILRNFKFKGVKYSEDFGSVKSIMQLIQFEEYIEDIFKVCEQYKLKECLADPKMNELLEIRDLMVSEETRDELTASKSKEYLKKIYEILDLTDQRFQSLKLFALIRDSAEFYQFLKEKNFKGTTGTRIFHQQHTLITQHLQHEEYNEQVLTHLLVAFRYISPVLDTKQNLIHLMNQVYLETAQQIGKGNVGNFIQLNTVSKNVHLLQLWFTRAEVSISMYIRIFVKWFNIIVFSYLRVTPWRMLERI